MTYHGVNLKHEPYAHQQKVLDESWDKPDWALFLEMGTGKTKIALDTTALWRVNKGLNGSLVYGKKGLYRNWAKEIKKCWTEDLPYRIYIYEGVPRTNKAKKEWEDFLSFTKKNRDAFSFMLINIEAMISPKAEKMCQDFIKACDKKTGMLIDESITIKNWKSKRTKAVTRLAKTTWGHGFRRDLNGTAIVQSVLDLWGQAKPFVGHSLGHRTLATFKAEYVEYETVFYGDRSFLREVGAKNTDKLDTVLDSFSHRITKKECLDLPDKMFDTVEVPLTRQQRSYYDQAAEQAMIMVEQADGDMRMIDATNVLGQLSMMYQILAGQLKVKNTNEYIQIPTERIDYAIDLIEAANDYFIIWCPYRHAVKWLADGLIKHFGADNVAQYHSLHPEVKRLTELDDFENGKRKILVGNQIMGGYGLTLIKPNKMAYYANNFSLGDRQQSEDRMHRIGQERPCTYYDMYSPNTVEPNILKALHKKMDLSSVIMKTPTREWLEDLLNPQPSFSFDES